LTPSTETEPLPKKRKIKAKKLLSFENDDEEGDGNTSTAATRNAQNSKHQEHALSQREEPKRKLISNPNTSLPAPKVMTKASLQAEAVTREKLRKEFLVIQEAVRDTEIAIPFVFYDGTNTPGGIVKIKKGDHVWLFLERCRKVGAELGVSGGSGTGTGLSSSKNDNRKAWARVGVDDLMCVRGNVIVPHVSLLYIASCNADSYLSTTSSTTSLRTRSKTLQGPVASCSTMSTRRRRRMNAKSLFCSAVQGMRDSKERIMILR
jgi:protein FAM50